MEIIQGTTIPFNIDLTTLGSLDSVIFEVFDTSRKKIYLKYKYPVTTGFGIATKVGNVYSFTITNTESANLLGCFGIEMTWESNTIESKAQCEGLEFIKQAQ